LKSTNPYLPDRIEFNHRFVKFKAGHGLVQNFFSRLKIFLKARKVVPKIAIGLQKNLDLQILFDETKRFKQ
jgi:hypothetical protein